MLALSELGKGAQLGWSGEYLYNFSGTACKLQEDLRELILRRLLCDSLTAAARQSIQEGEPISFTGRFAWRTTLEGTAENILMFDPVFFQMNNTVPLFFH